MANRKKQIEAIQQKLEPVAAELEGLIAELEEAYDNLPESIQGGQKGEAMQERIDTLTGWLDQLTDMTEAEV